MHKVQNIELHNDSFKWDYASDPTESLNKFFMHNFMGDTKPKLLSFKFLFLYLNRNTSKYCNHMQLNWKNSWLTNHLYVCSFQWLNGLNNVYIVFQSYKVLLQLFPILTTVVCYIHAFPLFQELDWNASRVSLLNAHVVTWMVDFNLIWIGTSGYRCNINIK